MITVGRRVRMSESTVLSLARTPAFDKTKTYSHPVLMYVAFRLVIGCSGVEQTTSPSPAIAFRVRMLPLISAYRPART